MSNFDQDLRPWAHRDSTPAILKTLPKPAREEFDFTDEGTAKYNREALEQAEVERQREIDSQIDPRLTPDEIAALYHAEVAKQAEVDAQQTQYDAARTFTAECGQYISTPENAKRMASWLEARGYDGSSADQYHEAFAALNTAGVLRVNPPAAQPRESFTDADLYSMPMERLENLARNPGKTVVIRRADVTGDELKRFDRTFRRLQRQRAR